MVQMEAIDSWMLTEYSMPNTYALMKAGINFRTFMHPSIWPHPLNTENLVNTGLASPSTLQTGDGQLFLSLPLANLSLKNYRFVLHRSSGVIYNRGKIHRNWGYSKYNAGST